mmetsp:Transcript_9298/g.15661  ORF Transcript_9298/g.15661 Transcript_9298/m.15661 type:complete len:217 (-) Transcript_9298:343-993(-)|eukprot:CAMPEP_0168619186 /NCGR_PEP_ID=MMETSP0449_2-20121227/6468_1 /TAXON_ID=1082188 /ORGANISM="Strombidium rassoulzadegani, Strain ras09" /LENGTH=216 /DNA_ID=CAMNT_0008660105 /DNA_START=102 /DNA_END=752 /DNA_ORIENTATION=+
MTRHCKRGSQDVPLHPLNLLTHEHLLVEGLQGLDQGSLQHLVLVHVEDNYFPDDHLLISRASGHHVEGPAGSGRPLDIIYHFLVLNAILGGVNLLTLVLNLLLQSLSLVAREKLVVAVGEVDLVVRLVLLINHDEPQESNLEVVVEGLTCLRAIFLLLIIIVQQFTTDDEAHGLVKGGVPAEAGAFKALHQVDLSQVLVAIELIGVIPLVDIYGPI